MSPPHVPEPPSASDPLAPYDYDLSQDAIATHPPSRRDGGRLLDLTGATARDAMVVDLPSLLRAGDLVVLNDTRVLHARVFAKRKTGGRVELLLLGLGEGHEVDAMARPARRLKVGEVLGICDVHGEQVDGMTAEVVGRLDGGALRLRLEPAPAAVMAVAGEVPLPPYFRREAEAADRVRYQTVFAREPGAVAAPTAGLHLTDTLFAALDARGVDRAFVTLHVGAGTFRNLRPEDLTRGELHAERWRVPEETASAIARCRSRGGRVVAIGTTSTRTLESAVDGAGQVAAGEGTTRLFVQPGYRFRAVDLLWTNLHLPRSSLLMLVCAMGGVERVMRAYRHAAAVGYRFFSYGDAMLVSPAEDADDNLVG